MKKHVTAFLRDEEGLTIVEYAVAAGLISAAVVLAFTNLGNTVSTPFTTRTTASQSRPPVGNQTRRKRKCSISPRLPLPAEFDEAAHLRPWRAGGMDRA